jgi:hypothetical protein
VGADGTDLVTAVESLKFDDTTILAADVTPTSTTSTTPAATTPVVATETADQSSIPSIEAPSETVVANTVASDTVASETVVDTWDASVILDAVSPVVETAIEAEVAPPTTITSQDATVAGDPVDDTPVDDTPVDDTPVGDTPDDDTPVAELTVADTPIADTPVDQPTSSTAEDEEVIVTLDPNIPGNVNLVDPNADSLAQSNNGSHDHGYGRRNTWQPKTSHVGLHGWFSGWFSWFRRWK